MAINNKKPYIITPFTWTLHFSLYLNQQRPDIDPMESWSLASEYVEMLPNLLTVSPYYVVDCYLEGEYP